jgi:hypothetical protein
MLPQPGLDFLPELRKSVLHWDSSHQRLAWVVKLGVDGGVAVRLDVVLGGIFGVLACVNVMTVGQMRVVRGLDVVPILMVFRGFAVMARSVLMVLRCLGVMMCSIV